MQLFDRLNGLEEGDLEGAIVHVAVVPHELIQPANREQAVPLLTAAGTASPASRATASGGVPQQAPGLLSLGSDGPTC